MQLQHVIPDQRLKREYLLQLCWQIGLSRYPLRRMQYSSWQWPLMVELYLLSDLRKALLYWLRNVAELTELRDCDLSKSKDKDKDKESQRTVPICEFTLLLGSLLSPVFYWRDRSLAPISRLLNRLRMFAPTTQAADQAAGQPSL